VDRYVLDVTPAQEMQAARSVGGAASVGVMPN